MAGEDSFRDVAEILRDSLHFRFVAGGAPSGTSYVELLVKQLSDLYDEVAQVLESSLEKVIADAPVGFSLADVYEDIYKSLSSRAISMTLRDIMERRKEA